jgi:hypothetical protein
MAALSIKTAQADIEAAYAQADDLVQQLADRIRSDVLVPYFKKRGWRFTSGNGTWLVSDRKGEPVYRERLPRHIARWLELDAGNGYDLGARVTDIGIDGSS